MAVRLGLGWIVICIDVESKSVQVLEPPFDLMIAASHFANAYRNEHPGTTVCITRANIAPDEITNAANDVICETY